jgi:hypothetical protein
VAEFFVADGAFAAHNVVFIFVTLVNCCDTDDFCGVFDL